MKSKQIVLSVILVSAALALFLAKTYIPKASVGWDEANHIWVSYRLSESLQEKNLLSFLKITFNQPHYPPLQSWFLGMPLALFGFSIEKARLWGLFWFVLGGLLIFVLGERLGGDKGKLTGVISLFFFLSSPIVLFFSSLAMKEMMGAALSLLVVLSYFHARKVNTPFSYLLVGLMLFVLTMTKYNYGFLMMIVIFLEMIISFFLAKKRQMVALSHLPLFVSFFILFGFWLLVPYNRIPLFLETFAGNFSDRFIYTQGLADFWGYFLFYPRAIVLMYSSSILVGIFLLISFVWAIRYFRDFRIRFLWLAVAVNLLLGNIYTQNMQERYIFTSVSFLFVLGGFVGSNFLAKLLAFPKRSWVWGAVLGFWLLVSGKILFDLGHLPSFVYSVGAYTLKSPVFNQTDFQDKNLWFNYDLSSWPKTLATGSYEKPKDVLEFVASSVDLAKPVEVVGFANEFSPPLFDLIFALHKQKREFVSLPYSSFMVTLEIFPTSRFYTRDYQLMNSWQIEKIKAIKVDPSLTLVKRKEFKELGVEVTIWGRSPLASLSKIRRK